MNMAPIILMLLCGLIPIGETCERVYDGCLIDEESIDVNSIDACMEIAVNNTSTSFAAVYEIQCDWSEWVVGECSVTCGEGTQTSTRTCEVPTACPCSDEEDCSTKTEVCTLSDCPVDGTWNDWVEGECSVTCGSGTITSTRTCEEPTHGGQNCSCSDLEDCTTKIEDCTQSECLVIAAIEPELRLYKDKQPAFDYSDSNEDTYITTSSTESLGDDWNDETDAAWAVEGAWALYIHIDYDDEITTLCPGEKKHEFNYVGDELSSVKYLQEVPEECNSGKLIIYSKDNYEGRRAIITSDVSNLNTTPDELNKEDSFDDNINSVQAIKGYWILYRNADYDDWYKDGLCIKEGDEVAELDDRYKDRVSSIEQVESCS